MNISAINASPIKPQTSFGQDASVVKADKVLSLSKDLSDSFKKEGQEDDIKTPLQTAVSIGGACASMFLLGAGAAKLAVGGYRKVPESAKTSVINGAKKARDFVGKQVGKLPKIDKAKTFYDKSLAPVVGKATKGVQDLVAKHGKAKLFTTTAGIVSAATLVPKIAKVDKNSDGIADIIQKDVNAYKGVFRTAEIFSDIVSVMT